MKDFNVLTFIRQTEVEGARVIVRDGNGRYVTEYHRIDVARDYFSMSNDAFFDKYKFNLVPTGAYYNLGKMAAGKM